MTGGMATQRTFPALRGHLFFYRHAPTGIGGFSRIHAKFQEVSDLTFRPTMAQRECSGFRRSPIGLLDSAHEFVVDPSAHLARLGAVGGDRHTCAHRGPSAPGAAFEPLKVEVQQSGRSESKGSAK
jgi:hypothetical protein